MNNVALVLSQAKALSEQEQQELLTQLEEYLVLGSQVAQVTKEVKEMRFSKGRVCCHCNGTNVVRNGKEMVCKDIYAEIVKIILRFD